MDVSTANSRSLSQPAKRAWACSPGWSEAESGVCSQQSDRALEEDGGRIKLWSNISVARFAGLHVMPPVHAFRFASPGAKCLRPLSGLLAIA